MATTRGGEYSHHKPASERTPVRGLRIPEDLDESLPIDQRSMRMQFIELWKAMEEQRRAEAREAEEKAAKAAKDLADEKRQDRRWLLRSVVLPIATLILGGGGVSLYKQSDDAKQVEKAAKDAVRTHADRLDDLERNVKALAAAALQQRLQASETTSYLSAQLAAISPKAQAVPEPPAVRELRIQADAIDDDTKALIVKENAVQTLQELTND